MNKKDQAKKKDKPTKKTKTQEASAKKTKTLSAEKADKAKKKETFQRLPKKPKKEATDHQEETPLLQAKETEQEDVEKPNDTLDPLSNDNDTLDPLYDEFEEPQEDSNAEDSTLEIPAISRPAEETPPKRGRGRPKKSEASSSSSQEKKNESIKKPSGKRRGRPPSKHIEKTAKRSILPQIVASSSAAKVGQANTVESQAAASSSQTQILKKRGRPKKESSSAVSLEPLQEVAPLVELSKPHKLVLLQSIQESLQFIGWKLPTDVGWKLTLRADGSLSLRPIEIDPDLVMIPTQPAFGEKENEAPKAEHRPRLSEQEDRNGSYKEDEVVLDFDDASQIFHRS